MPSRALGTGTNGLVFLDATFSPSSASANARINALKGAFTRPLISLIFPYFFHVRPYFSGTVRFDWLIEKK